MYYNKRCNMSDTLGSLIDKLLTVDLKMWNNQELLYDIRKMTFQDYKKEFFESEDGSKKLWEQLKKVCDLNCQRNVLIDEIDEKIFDMLKYFSENGNLDDGKYIQKKHKTY